MTLVRYRPWGLEPFQESDKFFDDGAQTLRSFAPALDIYEKGNDIIVETPLAGIKPEQVKIAIENDVLTIQGQTSKKTEVDDKNYYRKEVREGGFHRSVALPVSVEGGKATAEYDNGLLRVSIPKAAKALKKEIKVQIKKK